MCEDTHPPQRQELIKMMLCDEQRAQRVRRLVITKTVLVYYVAGKVLSRLLSPCLVFFSDASPFWGSGDLLLRCWRIAGFGLCSESFHVPDASDRSEDVTFLVLLLASRPFFVHLRCLFKSRRERFV